MATQKRGLKIGRYRITPLGIALILVLIVIIAAAVALAIINHSAVPDVQKPAQPAANTNPTATVSAGSIATAEPTATPQPTATPTPAPRSATVRMLGEITMENDLLKSVYNVEDQSFDFSPMFSLIEDVTGNADYTIAQVEGSMGDLQGYSGTSEKMLIPSALLSALKDAGVDMLTLANDHAMDGGFAEEQASVQNVAASGLDYVGAATSAEEKSTPVVKDINGIKVGFVAYCESLNVKEKNLEENALAYGINMISHSSAYSDIQSARNAGAEVIVALVDWGDEYSTATTKNQQKIAKVLVDAGADVILGYGPRVIQPIMWLEDTSSTGETKRALCLCAPGNFLSNKRDSGFDCGLIFEFTLMEQEDGTIAVESPKYIPTYALRFQDSNGLYQYRAMAVGQWTDDNASNLPEGVAYADLQYMATIWTNMQKYMGEEAASISRE